MTHSRYVVALTSLATEVISLDFSRKREVIAHEKHDELARQVIALSLER